MNDKKEESTTNEKPTNNNVLLFTGSMILVSLITLSLLRPDWSSQNAILFKTMLALSAASVAALIPGFLHLNAHDYVKAGGALGVFVFVMFFDPIGNPAQASIDEPSDVIPERYFNVVFTLKDPTGATEFDEGILTFALLDDDIYGRQGTILQNGVVKFDSISEKWRNRNVLLTLVSEKYLLKYDTLVYPLQSSILTYIKKVPLSYKKPVNDTPVSKKVTDSCPNRNPAGILIKDDIPDVKKSGSKWIFGYYKKEDGSCVWVPGKWVGLIQSDCPTASPNGYMEKKGVGRRGYTWLAGHWELRNDSCIWISGTWQKSGSGSLPTTNGRPAPTYVPPLRPKTY